MTELHIPDDAVQAFLAIDPDWDSDEEATDAVHRLDLCDLLAQVLVLGATVGPQEVEAVLVEALVRDQPVDAAALVHVTTVAGLAPDVRWAP